MRDEIWQARADLLRPYSGKNMPIAEVARQVGMVPQTVARYAKRFGFDFGADVVAGSRKGETFDRRWHDIAECAYRGLTRREAADELNLNIQTIGRYCKKFGIKFRRGDEGTVDLDRADTMASMYRAGRTLEEIGQVYGVTRERVRQIITKVHGITAEHGGQSLKARLGRAQRRAEKEAACLLKNGCTLAQLKDLRRIGREAVKAGAAPCKSPIQAFVTQKNSAKGRGIDWNIKLWDWWTIWQESGHWEDRGPGHGYVMCRFADEGAYEVGNVYIATGVHNSTVQPNNPYRKSHPDFEKTMAGKSGETRRRGCNVDGCDSPHFGHGWCNNHYYHFVLKPSRSQIQARAA